MSYKEKSSWISLVVIGFLLLTYLQQIYFNTTALNASSVIAAMISLVTWLVVLEVLMQTFLAIADWKQAQLEQDERDKLYNLISYKLGYFGLIFGIAFSFFILIINNTGFETRFQGVFLTKLPMSITITHVLLLSVIFAEILMHGYRVFAYRRDS